MKVLVLFLFAGVYLCAQNITYYTSYYLTTGNYTIDKSSLSNAGYVTAAIDYQWFPTVAYDHLTIKSKQWNYTQNMLLGGLMYSSYPYTVKAYYAYLPAEFTYKPKLPAGTPSFDYRNISNLVSFECSRYIDELFVGAAYTHLHAIGPIADFKEVQNTNQLTMRMDYPLTEGVTVSVIPGWFTSQRDKRSLFSMLFKLQYQYSELLRLKAGGMAGNRAYYFDNDLLTLFNQDETQTQNFNAQIDYRVTGAVSVAALYVHSEFTGYQINYLGAGIKGSW